MPPIYRRSSGPEDWKQFLAAPDRHWKTGHSAKSMAYSWEEADGLPLEVSATITDAIGDIPEPLIIIPEYKVALPGGITDSQNDAFLLCRIGSQTAVVMIEGKVDEPFGPSVGEWFRNASPGKVQRLQHLCAILGLSYPPSPQLRYQLFHRCASAIIEAERFKTDLALMIVHSFSQERVWHDDFSEFATEIGARSTPGELSRSNTVPGRPFYLGWVTGEAQYLTR
ncbi:hypothetical protein SAMN04488568_1208 [Maricaulis salignorans]|uniref:DUF6946 domain-containing protein n=2 Tax=Maricaulis salignorans TaxID=144026 RepID=A0A1G9VMB2_9PROT|nr:hypothetical protein SAMN04488568_1208 [Maricaulis salignorans]